MDADTAAKSGRENLWSRQTGQVRMLGLSDAATVREMDADTAIISAHMSGFSRV